MNYDQIFSYDGLASLQSMKMGQLSANLSLCRARPEVQYFLRGHVQMTSPEFSGFFTPSPLVSTKYCTYLCSFGQILVPPLCRCLMYMVPEMITAC